MIATTGTEERFPSAVGILHQWHSNIVLSKNPEMKKLVLPLLCLLTFCSDEHTNKDLEYKEELGKPLTEISGLYVDGDNMWAITDKPHAVVYSLDKHGKLKQEIKVTNADANDVEAVTADKDFVYIGDVGDNEGERLDRQIIKVAKRDIGKEDKPEVTAQIISFRFSDDTTEEKKKHYNYDCESVLSMGDSLYLFTKRRDDMQTELFSLSKTPGTYVAHSIAVFDSKGLVTDASINHAGNEVALIGYKKRHRFPFILLFKNFKGNNFFTGTTQRIELANQDWDWQLESISYGDDDKKVYFACEKSTQVNSTLYVIKRDKLERLDKKK